ncbi:uncharacterized protein LOC120770230 [Bactrocera tryoni]|uniref:uncharacterized protein LOC120770230 n=1 Tax=Bactrocera tryoni TaxID=59916 RepID=UPI001A964F3B|nr:uncharacterized protein LOC120770230 [Bactrocera tryoni]
MFKLVALLLFVNAVVGKVTEKPDVLDAIEDTEIHLVPTLQATSIIQEPTLAKVGDLIHSVPTAVSHQSSTIVHDRANVATPIVAPAIKTHITPVINSYVSPLARSYPSFYPYSYYYDFYPYAYKSIY